MNDTHDDLGSVDLLIPLAENWGRLIIGPLIAGALAVAATFLITPTFTARTTLLPPQQQSAANSALASLGSLSSLLGASTSGTPAERFVTLLQSNGVTDDLIDTFELMKVYDEKTRFETRRELERNVRIGLGKKDGLITVEVDDIDPQRAAKMANRHVEALGKMKSRLALSEAQQRRLFFEAQLRESRDGLTNAQLALEASGFTAGALRAEPKAAAESYARLRAEVGTAEVKLRALKQSLADATPEVQRQQSIVAALRGQVATLESNTDDRAGPSYVGKYRDFKYQEALYEQIARQYEVARLDEAREGGLIQVIDVATVPEKKSAPRRAFIGGVTAIVAFLLLATFAVHRYRLQTAGRRLLPSEKVDRLRAALRFR